MKARGAKLKARMFIGKYYDFPLKRELKFHKKGISRRTRGVLKRQLKEEIRQEIV